MKLRCYTPFHRYSRWGSAFVKFLENRPLGFPSRAVEIQQRWCQDCNHLQERIVRYLQFTNPDSEPVPKIGFDK